MQWWRDTYKRSILSVIWWSLLDSKTWNLAPIGFIGRTNITTYWAPPLRQSLFDLDGVGPQLFYPLMAFSTHLPEGDPPISTRNNNPAISLDGVLPIPILSRPYEKHNDSWLYATIAGGGRFVNTGSTNRPSAVLLSLCGENELQWVEFVQLECCSWVAFVFWYRTRLKACEMGKEQQGND